MSNNKKISTAPDYTGLSVRVVELANNPNFPKEYTGDVAVGFLDDYPTIYEATREVTKYKPLNDRDFAQMVSTGAIEYSAVSATILYDPAGNDGVNQMKLAFEKNAEIGLIMEAYDNGELTGTTWLQRVKLSKFAVKGSKGGKMQAEIEAEILGEPVEKSKNQAWFDESTRRVNEAQLAVDKATKLKAQADAGSDETAKQQTKDALDKANVVLEKAKEIQAKAQTALNAELSA